MVLELAHKMKANPKDYYDALPNETLLMLFEKPSLRTRVSLEVGMTELGGHAISYMIGDSPLGKKETYGDTGACLSRYVAAITARVTSREQINGLTATADVPVVNALDDWAHPMQILADMCVVFSCFCTCPVPATLPQRPNIARRSRPSVGRELKGPIYPCCRLLCAALQANDRREVRQPRRRPDGLLR